MKLFACGDIIPDCSETFRLATEDEVLAAVADHARDAHGIDDVTPELITEVRARIRTVES